jgi:hypothetical protein
LLLVCTFALAQRAVAASDAMLPPRIAVFVYGVCVGLVVCTLQSYARQVVEMLGLDVAEAMLKAPARSWPTAMGTSQLVTCF